MWDPVVLAPGLRRYRVHATLSPPHPCRVRQHASASSTTGPHCHAGGWTGVNLRGDAGAGLAQLVLSILLRPVPVRCAPLLRAPGQVRALAHLATQLQLLLATSINIYAPHCTCCHCNSGRLWTTQADEQALLVRDALEDDGISAC